MSAQQEGVDPQERCDRLAVEFQGVCERLHISNDDYIRTNTAASQASRAEYFAAALRPGRDLQGGILGYYSKR